MKNEGFTLIELLVSIGIFSVITGAVIADFRVGERSNELRLSADEFASKLRSVQTMAQTGRPVKLCDSGAVWTEVSGCPFSERVPSGGFGVHIDKDQKKIVLFADSFIAPGDTQINHQYNAEEALLNEEFKLPNKIVVDSIQVIDSSRNNIVDVVDLIFQPPHGDILVNGDRNSLEVRIQFKHSASNKVRSIILRSVSGRISVE